MCYSLYACARVKAVYAYLQLGQDARAKQVLTRALGSRLGAPSGRLSLASVSKPLSDGSKTPR
jgi:hypothetical protein